MFYADLHLHSPYSRATSPRLSLESMSAEAEKKGISLLGTADFLHPKWREELSRLEYDGSFYTLPGHMTLFVPSVEISLIYKQSGRVRKVHVVILSPDLETADQLREYFMSLGRVDYDGRPIFGASLPEVTEAVMEISSKNEIIPAHIWTPWFSLFGANSGFDSIKEAFGNQLRHIHALETGLSSDPPMNRIVSQLDSFFLVSNSDAHSPEKIGRELTAFDWKKPSYKNLLKSLRTGDGLWGTIEVDPGFGKYHFDGHRKCGVSVDPSKGIEKCPVCGKPLTKGVLHRVLELADRKEPKFRKKYITILPLQDIVASALQTSPMSMRAKKALAKLREIGTDMHIMLEAPEDEIRKAFPEGAGLIMKNREGRIRVKPGYDGEYGKIEEGTLLSF